MTTIYKKNDKLILKEDYDKLHDNSINKDTEKFLLKKELIEKKDRSNQFDFLYPHLTDPEFNIKIAQKKEFNENKYDGSIRDLEDYSNKLCNADFELNPHQLFVRNFLSFNTPYNSLLLYHGLGTGKTCTAITVAEEMRDYLKQLKIFQRIIVVASPNVQENFKLQLFDERKLDLVNNIWSTKSNCTGNKFLKELNPTGSSISKQKLVSQIKRLINESYLFMGYREFASYIHKVSNIEDTGHDSNKITKIQKKKLQKIFDNRLIIIDEVHNIRLLGTSDKHDKKIANSLTKLVKYTNNMRLLLLSGTPMYNHYSEIIWLINLMNLNDNRSPVNKNEIFDSNGDFVKDNQGNEIGKDLFIQKITGYVSFIRGENPYIFPYRIYPDMFNKETSIKSIQYPRETINLKPIEKPLQYMDLFMTNLEPYQESIYRYIIQNFNKKEKKKSFEELDSFGYNDLQYPIEALNIVYPIEDFNDKSKIPVNQLIGKTGLSRILDISYGKNGEQIKQYKYNPSILEKFGRIFSLTEIGKYSSKIFSICKSIINSEGIVLVYSQYIEGGLIPLAIALEELGFTRYGESTSLLKDNDVKKNNMKYVMITGDITHSKDNTDEINASTDIANINGDKVKVILISRAGSEGIDLKYIRQVHILEPWYNTSRIEQIIGRAIRSKSHCSLPFIKRNVQIFLYATLLKTGEEAADLYVYRVAETKAIQIGKISRLLKETCVDCIVHHSQINFTESKFNKQINIELSNNKTIDYNVGDKPFSNICDYMSECSYSCKPDVKTEVINSDTYDKTYIEFNNDRIIKKIKLLFKEHFFIKKEDLIKNIKTTHEYPLEHIYSALDYLINDKNELIQDRFGINGRLINIDNYYLFQPLHIKNNNISVFERNSIPNTKHRTFSVELKDKTKSVAKKFINYKNEKEEIKKRYDLILTMHDNKRGNKNNDIALSKVYHILTNKIDVSILNYLIIDHIIDTTFFESKLVLLNYIYFEANHSNLDDIDILIKNYFDSLIVKIDSIEGIYLLNDKITSEYNDDSILLIKHDRTWQKAKMTDSQQFNKKIATNLKDIYDKLNNISGYISYIKKSNIFVFKTIDIKTSHKKRGKRCDQAGKSDIIKIFNEAEEKITYNNENTKDFTSLDLCCLQELIFRYYTYTNKNDTIWFLSQHDAYLLELSNWKI